jgi:hypothetical protein
VERALLDAAASLKDSILLAENLVPESFDLPGFYNNKARSIRSLLASAAKALLTQLEQRLNDLKTDELNSMLAFYSTTTLAVELVMRMANPDAPARTLIAGLLGVHRRLNLKASAPVMTPLLARLVSAALPGSKVVVWLPTRLKEEMFDLEVRCQIWHLHDVQCTTMPWVLQLTYCMAYTPCLLANVALKAWHALLTCMLGVVHFTPC